MRNMCEGKAREIFKEHKATVVLQNENFFVLDWRKRNGYDDYFIRYVLDISRGCLSVSGDLGCGVACWYNRVTPENLVNLINDVAYFVGKLHCATRVFTYSFADQKEDIDSIEESYLTRGDHPEDELRKDFAEIRRLFENNEIKGKDTYPTELVKIIENYDDGWQYGEGFSTIGKRIDSRIILWTIGYRLAMSQIGERRRE